MRWIAVVALVLGGTTIECSSKDRNLDASIDAAIDAPPDRCLTCRSDQLCVARYDGVCGLSVECVDRTTDCPNHTCSATCEAAYCPRPYQCANRPPCGGESPLAFTCYGP